MFDARSFAWDLGLLLIGKVPEDIDKELCANLGGRSDVSIAVITLAEDPHFDIQESLEEGTLFVCDKRPEQNRWPNLQPCSECERVHSYILYMIPIFKSAEAVDEGHGGRLKFRRKLTF